ncbi:unnamed protein product, partial [Candidula unifasciata]
PDIGACTALLYHYYYNPDTSACETFIYGGCGGNKNNFQAEEKCLLTSDYCSLKPNTGPCEAIFNNFYYDADTSTCEKFVYGGCSGNKNNFQTIQECLET